MTQPIPEAIARAAERIDQTWLREIGGRDWDVPDEEDCYSLYFPAGEFVSWELRLAWGYGLSLVRLHDNRELVTESVELVNVKTRGQFLMLCQALGIPIRAALARTEAKQGEAFAEVAAKVIAEFEKGMSEAVPQIVADVKHRQALAEDARQRVMGAPAPQPAVAEQCDICGRRHPPHHACTGADDRDLKIRDLQSQLTQAEAERDELQSKLDSAHDPKSVGNIAWLAERYHERARNAEARLTQSEADGAAMREVISELAPGTYKTCDCAKCGKIRSILTREQTTTPQPGKYIEDLQERVRDLQSQLTQAEAAGAAMANVLTAMKAHAFGWGSQGQISEWVAEIDGVFTAESTKHFAARLTQAEKEK